MSDFVSNKKHCTYIHNIHGYVSGCGIRAAYNRYWKYCPFCGKAIVIIEKKNK